MRHITFPAGTRLFRLIAALILFGTAATLLAATPSTRPAYGGILRVQKSGRVVTLDPRQWPSDSIQAAATEQLASLVFDRLVRLDDHGVTQSALAVSWQQDMQAKRWQFRMREGVKFADGTPLTPEASALSLQQLLGNEFDVSATSDSVVILADHSLPDLPAQLATGRYFIFHSAADGTLFGTGPFRVTEWSAGDAPTKVILTANESCWAGRPFVDGIEITLGVDLQKRANAIAFGQADVVDLPASQVRLVGQRGVRTASSDPVELFALQFDLVRPAVQDARIREAISAAVDRASIADVVLQRQGVPAGSLLPNWLSGYAFLFPTALNLPRTKELLTAIGRKVSRAAPLVLVYDSGDDETRAVAERVAVNLKEAGITVQLSAQTTGSASKPWAGDMRLVHQRITSPDPAVALSGLLDSLGEPIPALDTPQQDYAAERAPIDAFRVIPVVHVTESYGLGPQVRDWMAPRWGGWRLGDVWLEPVPATGGTTP